VLAFNCFAEPYPFRRLCHGDRLNAALLSLCVAVHARTDYGDAAVRKDRTLCGPALSRAEKAIRDLNGIKPDSTPGQVELILEKTGKAIALQLPRVPNLICREDVADEAPPKQESADGMSQATARVVGVVPGRGILTQTPPTTKRLVLGDRHHFDYIIHANKTA
jgi:hypothetical protein